MNGDLLWRVALFLIGLAILGYWFIRYRIMEK